MPAGAAVAPSFQLLSAALGRSGSPEEEAGLKPDVEATVDGQQSGFGPMLIPAYVILTRLEQEVTFVPSRWFSAL